MSGVKLEARRRLDFVDSEASSRPDFALGWWERWTEQPAFSSYAELHDHIDYENFKLEARTFRAWREETGRQLERAASFHWAHKMLKKCMDSWRGATMLSPPSPLQRPEQIRAAFKWIAVTLPRRFTYDDTSFEFPYARRRRQYLLERLLPRRGREALLRHATGLYDAWVAYKLLNEWKRWTQEILAVRRNASEARERYRVSMMERFFWAWKIVVENQKQGEILRMFRRWQRATAEANAQQLALRNERNRTKRIIFHWRRMARTRRGLCSLFSVVGLNCKKKALRRLHLFTMHARFAENRITLRSILFRWAKTHHLKAGYRELCAAHSQRVQQTCMSLWYDKTMFRRRSRSIIEYMRMRRLGRVYRIVFLSLAVFAKERKRDVVATGRVRSRRKKNILNTWKKRRKEALRNGVLMEMATIWSVKRILHRPFQQWARYARCKMKLDAFQSCMSKKLKWRVFEAFKYCLRSSKVRRKQEHFAAGRIRSLRLQHAMCAWELRAHDQRCLKANLRRAARFAFSSLLQRYFSQWHSAARIKAIAKRYFERSQVREREHYFLRWVQFTRGTKGKRERLSRACAKFRCSLKARAFIGWNLASKSMRQHRAKVAHAICKWNQKALGSSFVAWNEFVEWARECRSIYKSVFLKWRKHNAAIVVAYKSACRFHCEGLLAGAFDTWRDRISKKQSLRGLCQIGADYHRTRCLSSGLEAVRSHSTMKRRYALLHHWASDHRRRAVLFKCIAKLRTYAERAADSREKLKRAHTQLKRSAICRTFAAWRNTVKAFRNGKRCLQLKVMVAWHQSVVVRIWGERPLLRRCLIRWRKVVHAKGAGRLFIFRWKRAQCAQALFTWKILIHEMKCASIIVKRIQTRVQRSAFCAWKERAREMSRVRCIASTMLFGTQMRLNVRVFAAWKAYATDMRRLAAWKRALTLRRRAAVFAQWRQKYVLVIAVRNMRCSLCYNMVKACFQAWNCEAVPKMKSERLRNVAAKHMVMHRLESSKRVYFALWTTYVSIEKAERRAKMLHAEMMKRRAYDAFRSHAAEAKSSRRFRVVAALRVWRDIAAHAAQVRRRVLRKFIGSRLLKCFIRWRLFCKVQLLWRKVQRQSNTSSLSLCFQSWTRFTKEGRQNRAARTYRAIQLQRAGLGAFRANAIEARKVESMSMFRKKFALRTLAANAQGRRARRQTLEHALLCWKHNLTQQLFLAWKGFLQTNRHLMRCRGQIESSRSRALRISTLLAWRKASNARKRANLQLLQALNAWVMKLSRRIFISWKEYSRAACLDRRLAQKRSFASWKRLIAKGKCILRKAGAMRHSFQSRRLRMLLSSWRNWTRSRREGRSRALQQGLYAAHQRIQRTVLCEWRRTSANAKTYKQRTFGCWKEFRRQHLVCRAVLSANQNRQKRYILRQWAILSVATAHSRNRSIQLAFRRMETWASARKRRSCLNTRALNAHNGRVSRKAYWAWKFYVVRLKDEHARMRKERSIEMLRRRCLHSRLQRTSSRCLGAWGDVAKERLHLRLCATAHWTETTKRRSMERWRLYSRISLLDRMQGIRMDAFRRKRRLIIAMRSLERHARLRYLIRAKIIQKECNRRSRAFKVWKQSSAIIAFSRKRYIAQLKHRIFCWKALWVAKRSKMQRLRDVFQKWKLRAEMNALLRLKTKRLTLDRERRIKTNVMHRWAERCEYADNLSRRARMLSKQASMRRSFSSWQQSAYAQLAKKTLFQNLKRKRENRLARRSLRVWSDAALSLSISHKHWERARRHDVRRTYERAFFALRSYWMARRVMWTKRNGLSC